MTPENYRGFRLYPPGARKGGPHFVARGNFDGRRIEISTGATELFGARHFVNRLLAAGDRQAENKKIARAFRVTASTPLPAWATKLLGAARWRASRKGLPFTLTPADMADLVQRADGQCEVTGIAFSDRHAQRYRVKPFSPSLDRINPPLGYTSANCRLVLYAVNVGLGEWGQDVLLEISDALHRLELERKGGKWP